MLLSAASPLGLLLATAVYSGLSTASPALEHVFQKSNGRGGVASESQECSQIGKRMLEIGVSKDELLSSSHTYSSREMP